MYYLRKKGRYRFLFEKKAHKGTWMRAKDRLGGGPAPLLHPASPKAITNAPDDPSMLALHEPTLPEHGVPIPALDTPAQPSMPIRRPRPRYGSPFDPYSEFRKRL